MTPLLWFSSFFLKKKVKVLVTQFCPTLCDPVDWNLLSSSVHGILQARTLESVANLFSRGSSWLRGRTRVSSTTGRVFTVWAREAHFFLKWHANRGQEVKHWGHWEQGKITSGTCLEGQWLRICAFHCRCSVWIPGQELRSHMTWSVFPPKISIERKNKIVKRERTENL